MYKELKNNYLYILNLISCFIIIAIGIKVFVAPHIATLIWKEDYKKMVFVCDNVMRDHLVAKNKVIVEANEENIEQLKSSEIGLISCHKYDKLRKKMQTWGVTEAKLGLIGLEAIEENADNVRKFVEIHEFNY